MHIESGRILWRDCLGTPGVYEYKDNLFYMATKSVGKHKSQWGVQELSTTC